MTHNNVNQKKRVKKKLKSLKQNWRTVAKSIHLQTAISTVGTIKKQTECIHRNIQILFESLSLKKIRWPNKHDDDDYDDDDY